MKEGFMKKLADFCFILMNMEKAFLSWKTNEHKWKRTRMSCLFKLQYMIPVGDIYVGDMFAKVGCSIF